MKRRSIYWLDLKKIEGYANLPCPSCGAIISPDDETGDTYNIADVKENEEGLLEEIVILCRKCGTIIHLEGFEALEKLQTPMYNTV